MNTLQRCAIGLLAVGLSLGGCAEKAPSGPPQLVPLAKLDGLLLSPGQINKVMGTTDMTAHQRVTDMGDHRDLLPNLNCLGIWQVNEAGVYGKAGWIALRQELLRSPDTEQWDNLVVQSVVSYPSADDALTFLHESSDRWSKCTDHHVNITLNGKPLPRWTSGALTTTDTRLAIPVTRVDGDQTRLCQRVLDAISNVIIDVQACKPNGAPVNQASAIADKIEAALPR